MLLQRGERIAVVLQQIAHVGQVHAPVAVEVGHFGNLHLVSNLLLVRAVAEVEQQFVALHRRAVEAGGNEFAEPERVEVEREILEEIALVRVVAVAEHGLAAEVLLVVFQFVGDVLHLCVELVLLGTRSGVQVLVTSHSVIRFDALLIIGKGYNKGTQKRGRVIRTSGPE